MGGSGSRGAGGAAGAAVAAFAAGLALGGLFAGWLLRAGDPASLPAPAAGGGGPAGVPDSSRYYGESGGGGGGNFMPRYTSEPGLTVSPGAAETGPAAEPPLVAATLRVVAVRPDGAVAAKGLAYALPAGQPGGRAEECPRDGVDASGTAVLSLPQAGAWDVGFVAGQVSGMVRDVVVARGEDREIRVPLPAAAPVRFLVDGGWPPGPGVSRRFEVRIRALDPPPPAARPACPGRGVPWPGEGSSVVSSGDGTGEIVSEPYPADRRLAFAVHCRGSGHVTGATGPGWDLVADPGTGRAGDTVVLRPLRRGAITLHLRPPPGTAAPSTDDLRVLVTNGRDGATTGASLSRDDGTLAAQAEVAPGIATITWSGVDWAPGRIDLAVDGGAETSTVVELVPLPGATATGEPPPAWEAAGPLGLEVAGLPAVAEGEERYLDVAGAWTAAAREEAGPNREYGLLSLDLPLDGEDLPPAHWRLAGRVLLFSGSDLASDPADVPATGPLRASLRPAGLVVVVPDRHYPEHLGTVVLRRPDGLPVPVMDADDFDRGPEAARDEVAATPGAVLGPFVEGPLRLEAWLGRVRLGTAEAEVRAGRIVPLVLRR